MGFCITQQIHGCLRIPPPSVILQALAQPQHPQIPTDSSSQQDFANCTKATTSTDSYGFQLPAAFCKLHQSQNIHGFLRIPAPSRILQTVSKPQHPRMPTDSSSQQHFGGSSTAATPTDAYGFQLPAAFCKLHQSHNIHGFVRIPAPSSILKEGSKPQHPRMPTDSNSQQHFAS